MNTYIQQRSEVRLTFFYESVLLFGIRLILFLILFFF
jgi:hypothetical protein